MGMLLLVEERGDGQFHSSKAISVVSTDKGDGVCVPRLSAVWKSRPLLSVGVIDCGKVG